MKKAIYIFKGKCNGVDIVKVIIIILLIVITIVGSWYFVFNWLQGNANDLKSTLDDIQDSIESNNWDEANYYFQNLNDKWIKLREFWTILLDHHEIDNIDLAMSKAKKYIEDNSKALALGEIEVLSSLVNIVVESESFTLSNIL